MPYLDTLNINGTDYDLADATARADKSVFYGTCSTEASTGVKVVICPEFTESNLVKGTVIRVQFSYANSIIGPALNINNTGAKNITISGALVTATNRYSSLWRANECCTFIYSGSSWEIVGKDDATTSYYGVTKLEDSISSTSTTTAATPNAVKQVNDKVENRVYYSIDESADHYNVTSSHVFDYHDSNEGSIMGLHIASEDPSDSTNVEDKSLQWNDHLLKLWDNEADARVWELDTNMAANKMTQAYASTDLNTLTSPGIYFTNANCTNNPVAKYGLLTVYTRTDTTWIFQRWQNIGIASNVEIPLCYERTYSSGAWSDWKAAYTGTFTTVHSAYTDFNQLTTPGFYDIGSVDGLTNGPDGTKYFLVAVFAVPSGSTIRQFAWPTASNASTLWMRTYRSSWGSWYSIDNNDTPLFHRVRYSYTYSCAANNSVNVSKDNLGISVPSGFSMAGYTGISTSNANVIPRSWNPWATQTGASIVLRNVSGTAANNQTLTVDVLYIRSSNF